MGFEISRGYGVCYFMKELNIIIIEGSSWIKINLFARQFENQKMLKMQTTI